MTTNNSGNFRTVDDIRAQHISLLQQRRETGLSVETIQSIATFVSQVRYIGIYLHKFPERQAVQSLLDYWDNILQQTDSHAIDDVTLLPFDANQLPELDDNLCPYRGLYAFNEEDQAFFFGRTRLIQKLDDTFGAHQMVALVGPSGSGKSSAIMAGLLPLLKAKSPSEKINCYYLVPGSNPLRNLAKAITEGSLGNVFLSVDEIESQLANDVNTLSYLFNNNDLHQAVIVVDQFEELFTLCSNEQIRMAFIDNLISYFGSSAFRNHKIILTLRSDFEPFIQRLPETFQQDFQRALVRVMPMNPTELREAIMMPAQSIGLEFDDGVVEGLVHDLLGEPAALPLLQFTLLKLWELRERNRVTQQAYQKLGGGRQALAYSADRLYESLLVEEQEALKAILLRLIRPTEGLEVTSRRVRFDALYQRNFATHLIDNVLWKLKEARLIRITGAKTEDAQTKDTQIEIAHEALIRNWPRLVNWIEDERAKLRRRVRLTVAAEEWERLGREKSALLRGGLLSEALDQDDLSGVESDFVQASRDAQDNELNAKQRRIRQLSALFSVSIFLLIIAIASLFVALEQSRNAEGSANVAATQAAMAVVARSTSESSRATAVGRLNDLTDLLATQESLNLQLRSVLSNPTPISGTTMPGTVQANATSANALQATIQSIDGQIDQVRITQTVVAEEILLENVESIIIGYSVLDIPIQAIQIGHGPNKIVFIGGIHHGIAPSTVSLSEAIIEYFEQNIQEIPQTVALIVVPDLNPDSSHAMLGDIEGRYNAHGVDLNRNWDCNWTANPIIRDEPRENAGGTAPNSEPETQALRAYLLEIQPVAVIIWGGPDRNTPVIPGGCSAVKPETQALASLYATASGYTEEIVDYNILEGDVSNWLDYRGIPAIFVLLPHATRPDFENNLAGIKSVIQYYDQIQ